MILSCTERIRTTSRYWIQRTPISSKGAKKRLAAKRRPGSEPVVDHKKMIENIKEELQDIIEEL
jgi:hypothetical protein